MKITNNALCSLLLAAGTLLTATPVALQAKVTEANDPIAYRITKVNGVIEVGDPIISLDFHLGQTWKNLNSTTRLYQSYAPTETEVQVPDNCRLLMVEHDGAKVTSLSLVNQSAAQILSKRKQF